VSLKPLMFGKPKCESHASNFIESFFFSNLSSTYNELSRRCAYVVESGKSSV